MMLWLRVRRARTCALTILAMAAFLALSGHIDLPLPNLLGGPRFAVPFALLLPVAVAIALAFGLASGNPPLEETASRHLPLLDAAYAATLAFLALGSCAAVQAAANAPYALAAGRNVLAYVGLALIGRPILGANAAALLPAGFVVASSLFRASLGGRYRWWSWPLAPSDDGVSWGIATVFLVVGIALTLKPMAGTTWLWPRPAPVQRNSGCLPSGQGRSQAEECGIPPAAET